MNNLKKIIFFWFLINIAAFSREVNLNFNVENGEIYFFNEKDLKVQNASFYNGGIKLNLKDEVYNFTFMSPSYPRINKRINIAGLKGNLNIEFSHKNSVMIQGNIHSGDLNIGKAKVTFTDSKNVGYDFETDIFGNFTAYLEKGKYRISTDRIDYKLAPKNQIIYNFTNSKVPYKVSIDLTPIPSFIKGRATDENGNTIKFPTFFIKLENKILQKTGDEFGMFDLELPAGMVTIMAKKDGYYENGTVLNMDKNSSVTNIEIPLTRIRASISGIITNGVRPLRNIKIILHDDDFNKIETVRSDINGFYEFYKIPSKKNVFITAIKGNKILTKSKNFDLVKDIKNFNLIIQE